MNASLKTRLSKFLRACIIVNSILFLALAVLTIFILQATADNGKHSNTSSGARVASCEAQLLPQTVISDLCNRGLVPIDIGQCDVRMPQLRREHTETIIRASVELNSSTHQMVKEAFGQYEVACSETNRIGNYYICEYDLSGDGPVIAISYDANTQIVKSLYIQQTGC
jgi:hypothetical protein